MHHARRLGSVVAGAVAVLALAAPLAQAAPPAPGFEEFRGCPDQPDIELCVRAIVTGGHIKLGSKDVPVTRRLELNGGVTVDGRYLFGPEGGLDAPDLEVPGGLAGITGFPEDLLNLITLGGNRLFASSRLAGTPSNPIIFPFRLPLKVKLKNVFLSNCFIGSDSNPVAPNLTTDVTSPPPGVEPIRGRQPLLTLDPDNENIIVASNGLMVDNAFSVPGADGCNGAVDVLQITDALVNAQSGLPAEAGESVAELEFRARVTSKALVYPS